MELEEVKTLKTGDRLQFAHHIIKSETYKGTVLLRDDTVGVAILFDDGKYFIVPFADRRWSIVSRVTGEPQAAEEEYITVIKAQARIYTDDNCLIRTPSTYLMIENAFLLGALIAKGLS